jgi:hypothetical protein
MAAAEAAPGGGLLCAKAGGSTSVRMEATPIEAKIVLRIVSFPFVSRDACFNFAWALLYMPGAGPGALALKLRHPYLH